MLENIKNNEEKLIDIIAVKKLINDEIIHELVNNKQKYEELEKKIVPLTKELNESKATGKGLNNFCSKHPELVLTTAKYYIDSPIRKISLARDLCARSQYRTVFNSVEI